MNRRTLMRSVVMTALLAMLAAPQTWAAQGEMPGAQPSQTPLDVEALLFDPKTPTGGNPEGDVTIVAFFDYNCGYCKQSSPALEKLVKEDGKIRLVYKDWPILAKSSVSAAHLALAANYQNKYQAAHKALIALPNRSMTDAKMSAALKAAGIDLARLSADLDKNAAEIGAILVRNNQQAEALQLPGTPVYLVGPYKVAASLDYQGFKDVVADARKRASEN
ncbi:DsbA family protein [Ancylobacter sp. A5.8]|uniref:DsbA family protein n=1 Tax=Ancylobacter gelatini TaxID=2919920 RepID=UPI001F4D9C9F|nr:DsbA family protein [Ancylobacter gelatini]MCJ8145117.1 DsbA family protein [Ancylobacter gelatini]